MTPEFLYALVVLKFVGGAPYPTLNTEITWFATSRDCVETGRELEKNHPLNVYLQCFAVEKNTGGVKGHPAAPWPRD